MTGTPIVIAHHIMWTLYGWWLPNDPRGSTSNTIRQDYLTDLGEPHLGRRKIQPASADIHRFYEQARTVLKHPLLAFAPTEFPTVGQSLGDAINELNYTCYAAAVMPDHVHLLIRKHRDKAEDMIEKIQHTSRSRLSALRLRNPDHPCWTRGGWKVFLEHPDDIRRTIGYIENNPLKMKLPAQQYDWVKPYDNWPLHEGHSPHSPYAKALKRAGRYP